MVSSAPVSFFSIFKVLVPVDHMNEIMSRNRFSLAQHLFWEQFGAGHFWKAVSEALFGNNRSIRAIKQSLTRGTASCVLEQQPHSGSRWCHPGAVWAEVQWDDPSAVGGSRQMAFLSLACVILAPTPGCAPSLSSVGWRAQAAAATAHPCHLWASPLLQPPAWQAAGPGPQEHFILARVCCQKSWPSLCWLLLPK